MAGLVDQGSNPDVSLLYDINGVAERAPHSADRAVELIGEYGCVGLLGLLAVAAWLAARRRPDAPAAVAAVLWSGLAAGVALLFNIPIRGLVERPRPFLDHAGLEVLVEGKTDYSFASDHATLGMAIAVGLFLVSRKLGLVAIAVAFFQGFARVYMGVHYPSDVIGGFALGTATALLLAPLALALLTPLTSAVARSPLRPLVAARPRPVEAAPRTEPAGSRSTDLAA
jgi:undecaprenyl-diphosphatase